MNLSDEEFQKEKRHLELTTDILREQISTLAQDLYDNEEKGNHRRSGDTGSVDTLYRPS